jgi:TolB protein
MNKTMRMRIIIALILVALIATIPSTALSQYYLGVIKGEAKKIPLAVIDIYDDAGAPALRSLVLDVLQSDLRRSQIFDVLDPKKIDLNYAGKDDPAAEIVKRGGTLGLTGAVWARLSRKGSDLTLSGRLYDAVTGMRMANKEYYGNEETVRRMVHTFADEIVSQYTGEKGVARTRIAFVSDKTGKKELYVMDYDGQNLKKLTADRAICMSPAWSPDGRILAYVSYRDKNPDLFGLDMETGRRWKISSSEGLNISPAWSPNGKRLAMAMSRDGGAEIYTISMEGNDVERLTYGIADNVSPSWSPNGREIVFTSGRGGSPQLYIMGVDGSDPRRITYEGSYNASPHWSPRGDRIVFASQVKGLFKIATVNPDGSDLRILTDGPGNDENPMWSPTGRQIVFSSTRKGKTGIFIMNADGTELERITPNDANYASPAWSP